MIMPKVSVIIPIYGVEKYIARCVRSLMEQTLDDMEFIFVNDCTRDHSMEVLDEILVSYSSRIHQVKVINKPRNEGISFARKTGLENATGQYVGFCDSDDWIDMTMFEKLYNKAVSGNLDYVKCGYVISDGDRILSDVPVKLEEISDKNDIIRDLLRCRGMNSIWNTITRKEIIDRSQLVFTENAMLEDFFLASQIIENCSSFGMVGESLYYYYQNPDSICNVPTDDAFIKRGVQAKKNVDWILNYFHQRYGDKFGKEEVVLKNVPRRIIIPIMKNSSNYPLWNSFFSENSWKFLWSSYVSLTLKLQYLLVVLHLYPLYKKLR